jgi:signal transduction histidine kinase
LVADRERLFRALPFAVVAVLGQASAGWPPGPDHLGPFWLSTALLLATGIPVLVLAEPPPIAWLMSALTYTASVAFLMLATGGVTSGFGSLLMIPIVAVALYGRPRDSAIALAVVVATMLAVSFATPHVDSATVRRSFIFGATGAMLSVAVHALRRRLVDSNERVEQLATMEERRRIARELHDGLAHELAYIASKAKRAAGPDATPFDTREVAGAADRALDEARRAITLLTGSRPQPLNQAVAQTAEDLGSRLGLAVCVDVADEVDMAADVTEHLLRIVREAMTNAANHAGANHVTVRLRDQHGVRLIVEDDGCGFDPARRGPRAGFGLVSMEERATSVGAQFKLDSAPSRGTRIEVAFA